MQEEFHGINHGEGVFTFKQLYDWKTLNAKAWLPSLSELVGITGTVHPDTGVYYSAMQGLNTSTNHFIDVQGGTQFAYFKQFNTSGGGQIIWDICNQERSWLRSVRMDNATHGWIMLNQTYFHTPAASSSHAVHPVVELLFFSKGIAEAKQIICQHSFVNPRLLYRSFWIV